MEEKKESISKITYQLEYKEKGTYGDNAFLSERKDLIELEKEIENLKLDDKYHSFKIYEIIIEGTKTTKLYKDFDKGDDGYNVREKAKEILNVLKNGGINLETLDFRLLEQILKESSN
jgi:hypothetical protein